MDAGPLVPGKHDVGGWGRISLEGTVRSRNLGQNSCCAAPARGALLALGLLLVTPAPGWGQDADRTIPCVDGMAGGYACDRVDLLGRLSREELGAADTVKLNDVWGWTDPQNGREYALVGRMDGTAFVDVTDPYDPRYLGSLAGTAGSRISIWRDMKVFRDHAFIVAGGTEGHGMQVFDLTQLRDVTDPRDFAPAAVYTGIESAINVAVNIETGFAYLTGSTGGETCGGGLHMVDIGSPLDPVFAGCFADPDTGRRGTGTSHDTQCVVYRGPDPDYQGREICVSSNETAVSVADVTDKRNPVAVADASYPAVAYAHQGWLTEDHRHFYSGDEMDEAAGLVDGQRTLIWDVTDLDDPVLFAEYIGPNDDPEHNLHVRGGLLFLATKRSGLRVLDIGERENPVEAGYFDTTPASMDSARTTTPPPGTPALSKATGFDGAWSVYPFFTSGNVLVSSRSEGLFVVRPRAGR